MSELTILPSNNAVVSGTVNARPIGLTVGGKITRVTLNNTTWVALPAAPLANRNALAVQNPTGNNVYLNYNNAQPGLIGVLIRSNGERMYPITDQIVVYGKSNVNGTVVTVEELA